MSGRADSLQAFGMSSMGRHPTAPKLRLSLIVTFGSLYVIACGASGREYSHLGVLAGALNGQPVSGTVGLMKVDDELSGRVRLSTGAELVFNSDGGAVPVDGRVGFFMDTGTGTTGEFVFGSSDGGPEQFIGRLLSGDGGLTAATRGSIATDQVRLYCGSFSGSAVGVWNFSISSGLLLGAYSGFDGTSPVQGYLSGSLSGNEVRIVWSELFGNGTAVGQVGGNGASVSGTWQGYRDGGAWSSSESCPAF